MKVIAITRQHPQVHCTPLTHSYTHALIYSYLQLLLFLLLLLFLSGPSSSSSGGTHTAKVAPTIIYCGVQCIAAGAPSASTAAAAGGPGIKVDCVPYSVVLGLAKKKLGAG